MKNLLFYLFGLVLFISCTPKSDLPENVDVVDSMKNIELSYVPILKNLGKYSYLGYSYDITKKYLYDDSPLQVIDINKISLSKDSDYLMTDWPRVAYSQIVVGRYLEEYLSELSRYFYNYNPSDRNNYITGMFSDEIWRSGTNIQELYKYAYGYSDIIGIYKRYRINAYRDYEYYFTPEFQKDLERLNSDEVIEKYGTHVYFGVFLGFKLHIDIAAQLKDNDSRSLEIAIQQISAKYLYPQMSWYSEDDSVKNILNWKLNYYCLGGDSDKKIFGQFDKFNAQKINLDKWKESLNENNAELVKAVFVPIYEIIQDSIKSAELKTAYKKYIISKKLIY